MIKFNKLDDATRTVILEKYGQEILEEVEQDFEIMDAAWGTERSDTEGGVVIFIDEEDDFALLEDFNEDIETSIPEYVEFIETSSDVDMDKVLIIQSSGEFNIIIYMPEKITPERFNEYRS